MFSKRVHGMSVGLLTLAIALIVIGAACGDGGDEAPTAPPDTPAADGAEESPTALADTPTAEGADQTPAASPNPVVETVAPYLADTGLDGNTFELSQPVNCKVIVDEAAKEAATGKVCIHFANSKFGETSGVAEVWVFGTEAIWELTMELQDGIWVVTGAEETTPPADEQ